VPVKPEPAVPSPAATVVLLRDRPAGGVECLLMRRHLKSKFAAGDFVFPGGKIETDDNPDDAVDWCRGLEVTDAARKLSLEAAPRTALGYWVGVIRETFEEAGLLLAVDAGGREVAMDAPRFAEYRRACHADNRAFWAMVRAEGLKLTTDRLVYFAHWITPEEQPLRFDTRFFAAVMPPGQEPVVDGHEIVDLKWLTPAEAISASARKDIGLRNPTIKNLELVAAGGAAASIVVESLGRREVQTIRPRMVQVDGKPLAVLPGDPRWY
jgi:8-oxo-dGTP pyrophosphatase MutT (NUDIX family)